MKHRQSIFFIELPPFLKAEKFRSFLIGLGVVVLRGELHRDVHQGPQLVLSGGGILRQQELSFRGGEAGAAPVVAHHLLGTVRSHKGKGDTAAPLGACLLYTSSGIIIGKVETYSTTPFKGKFTLLMP